MPTPLAQRCFDTSQFSHAILVTFELLQNFELLRGPCIGVAGQINCAGESSVTFLATITRIL